MCIRDSVKTDVRLFDQLSREILGNRMGARGPHLVELCLKVEQLYAGPLYVPCLLYTSQPYIDAMLSNLSLPCTASTEPQTRGESNSMQGASVRKKSRDVYKRQVHEGEPRQGQPEALQRVAENVALVAARPGKPRVAGVFPPNFKQSYARRRPHLVAFFACGTHLEETPRRLGACLLYTSRCV